MQKIIESNIQSESSSTKPFIRWAGGKQNLIRQIFEFVDFADINRYFEPFLGGGSFFLRGNFKYPILSDLNDNLINCYHQIKKDPLRVHQTLSEIKTPVLEEHYYKIREEFNRNSGEPSLDQAVRFIFLNKTSFNGIYRVNRSGSYNVPFGKANPAFAPLEQLRLISSKLQNATLFCGYYDEILNLVGKNDLVYLDPPYPKLSETAYFNHYTLDKFGEDEQIKVAAFAQELHSAGCKVIISNADLPSIKELYGPDWNIKECSAYRTISCKKIRIKVKELIIRNFENERT